MACHVLLSIGSRRNAIMEVAAVVKILVNNIVMKMLHVPIIVVVNLGNVKYSMIALRLIGGLTMQTQSKNNVVLYYQHFALLRCQHSFQVRCP